MEVFSTLICELVLDQGLKFGIDKEKAIFSIAAKNFSFFFGNTKLNNDWLN